MSNEKTIKEYPDFCQEVDNLKDDQLKARIVQMQKELAESEEHKEQNEALKAAREELKELSSPYRDVRKAVKAKTAYILDILNRRGK